MSYKILMITSEAVPFAKSGGLADMVSALSIALNKYGSDVRILMPLYGFINTEKLKRISNEWEIPFSNRTERATLFVGSLPGSQVPVYFLYASKFFDRDGIYGPTADSAYPDNGPRYSLLCQAALHLEDCINWHPEIFHSHDWPTGLNPVYLKKEQTHEKKGSKRASVFTIHNMGYQGNFSPRELPWAGLSPEEVEEYGISDGNRINYLKSGIENSDMITTVSPTYAKEIQTKEFGHGLNALLAKRSSSLVGIVNGVDYNDWDPGKDKHIAPHNYTLSSMEKKKIVKRILQEEMGLEESDKVPLYAMVTRLVNQKGINELCGGENSMLEEFCRSNAVQVVILGTGESWCENELKRLNRILPNLAVRITYNDYLSHLIEAGADFFMMPSHYEPCGLNQLYSLRYGTLPIVRRTGGLTDTVTPPDQNDRNGTGFLFEEISSKAFLKAAVKASSYWYDKPDIIREMQRHAMKQDFSWGPSAEEYLKVYQRALG